MAIVNNNYKGDKMNTAQQILKEIRIARTFKDEKRQEKIEQCPEELARDILGQIDKLDSGLSLTGSEYDQILRALIRNLQHS